MQQQKTYQSYISLHEEFNHEHRILSKRITDMYQLPKEFMEEHEKGIQNCLNGRVQDGAPHHSELSHNGIRDFLFIVEDFKLQTMELFFEHRVHIDKCTIYVMKVSELQNKHEKSPEYEEECIKLIPQLEELKQGLNNLLSKAEMMVENLEQIKTRWQKINPTH